MSNRNTNDEGSTSARLLANTCYQLPFRRVWEMPNSNTFDIKCISQLIHKYHKSEMKSIDPFANKNKIAKITNDLDPEMKADYCMDALDFLKQFETGSIDFVLYDPLWNTKFK